MVTKKKIFIGLGILAALTTTVVVIKMAMRKKWRFTDNHWSTQAGKSNLGFIGDTKPPFNVGDIISVKQDAGAKYPEYDGETVIDGIYQKDGKWIVDVAKPRKGDTPANAGVITL